MTPPKSEVRILIIDDEKDLCALLAEYLSSKGYQTDVAYDGVEGLEKFSKSRYHVVLCDIRMPKLSGIETLEAIKRQDLHVEVILLTAYGSVQTAVKALQLGAYDFIEKPVQLERLTAVIDRALDRRELTTIKGFEETTRAVFSTIHLPDLLPLLADLARTVAPCEEAFIALPGKDNLELSAWSSLHEEGRQGLMLEVAKVVARHSEPSGCFTAAPAVDPRFSAIPGIVEIRHLLAYPMWFQSSFLGVLALCRTRGEQPFSATETQNFFLFAALVTQAVKTARLYSDLAGKMQELQRAEQKAIQFEKMAALGRIISGLAHELKNPLAGILINVELLSKAPQDARTKQIVSDIELSTNRCCGVIDNLLAYSRAARKERDACAVPEMIEAALLLLNDRPEFKSGRAKIAREFDRVGRAFVNSIQIEQVFRNILLNAAQAIQDGGTIKIRLRELTASAESIQRWAAPGAAAVMRDLEALREPRGEPWVVIEIGDDGVGIPAENLSRIFEPFFTTKSPGNGTGLGLYLSYEIVHANGGALWVASPGKNKGTTFFVALPAVREPVAPAARPKAKAGTRGGG